MSENQSWFDMLENHKLFRDNTREQALEILKDLYQQGFRWIVRDDESEYVNCYTLNPKKYRDGNYWGYVNENDPKAEPAETFKCAALAEIRWQNRSATSIGELLGYGKLMEVE